MRKIFLFLFIFGVLAAPKVQSQLITLNPERTGHAATLLQSGKVLITGGVNETAVLSSALLYDPPTGAFTSTGSIATARENHTSTLLLDGRVLITGGDQNGTPLQTAELYDPATGAFSLTPQGMRKGRTQHTATLLTDGTVLVVGGQSADIFDPSRGTFTQTIGSPVQGRKSHMATRFPDGKVLSPAVTLTMSQLRQPRSMTRRHKPLSRHRTRWRSRGPIIPRLCCLQRWSLSRAAFLGRVRMRRRKSTTRRRKLLRSILRCSITARIIRRCCWPMASYW